MNTIAANVEEQPASRYAPKCAAAVPPVVWSAPCRAPLLGLLRCVCRSVGFTLVCALAATDYARGACFLRRAEALHWRALWLQRWSRVVCRLIGLKINAKGIPPSSGMIASNHLSYLDILAYSALVPCVFVAKKEVATWPILGLFARIAGTIFVDRTRRMAVRQTNVEIQSALSARTIVVVFPEGTSSDGRTVLPFKPSLLEPVLRSHTCVAPAGIAYDLDDGCVGEEVCYWGRMTLLPHLLNLFRKRRVRAQITFGVSKGSHGFRKELAAVLQNEVETLRAGNGLTTSSR